MVGLPLLGEAADRGRRQAGCGAENLLQGGPEVARGQAVQAERDGSASLIYGDLRHQGGKIAESTSVATVPLCGVPVPSF